MREALKTRVSHYYEYFEEHDEKELGSAEAKLRVVKTLLANGMMLVTGVNQDEKSFLLKKAEKNTAYANTGEEFVIRIGATCDAAHAITIVGYDDNKGIDINGDRKVTGAEKGDFKVRNSWGTNAHNNGEYWVLYDAIVNSTSQIETSSDLYAEENFKEVELRRIVTEEDGQTITTGFCAYVDNVTTAAIEIGDRDSLK